MEIPIENDNAKWRITLLPNGVLKVRLFELNNQGTPRVFAHMPAGNVVLLDPTLEA